MMHINVGERDLLDGQIQELIKGIASTYFDGDVEEAVAYVALMGECVNMANKALKAEPCEDWYDVPSDEMTLGQARQAVKDLRKKLAEYLGQEPILDKIIADIGGALSEEALDDNRQQISDVGIGLEIALSIIDKYKVEDA